MHVLTTTEGQLIYAAMAAYVAAAALLPRWRRLGWAVYALGFAASVGAFVLRWRAVGHVPLKNLYEVMLFVGVAVFPLSILCRAALRVGAEWLDAMIGAAFLFPVGFVFDAVARAKMPALQSPLFVPHVLAYMLGYVVMAKATGQAVGRLICRGQSDRAAAFDRGAYRMVALGFPLLTTGLLLGAWWGKLAWTDYWHWDPKELWSLAGWLSLLIYLHYRRARWARPTAAAAMVIVGMVLIVITLLWVNLSRLFPGLHSYAR